MALTTIYKTK